MKPDPGLFLSTIILASGGLVAIIGGLLVAKFVGLDSDERTSRKALIDAVARLDSARRRAKDIHHRLLRWDAWDFLSDQDVLNDIGQGVTDLETLRRHADTYLTDEDLRPFVQDVAAEFSRAA